MNFKRCILLISQSVPKCHTTFTLIRSFKKLGMTPFPWKAQSTSIQGHWENWMDIKGCVFLELERMYWGGQTLKQTGSISDRSFERELTEEWHPPLSLGRPARSLAALLPGLLSRAEAPLRAVEQHDSGSEETLDGPLRLGSLTSTSLSLETLSLLLP